MRTRVELPSPSIMYVREETHWNLINHATWLSRESRAQNNQNASCNRVISIVEHIHRGFPVIVTYIYPRVTALCERQTLEAHVMYFPNYADKTSEFDELIYITQQLHQ